MTQIVLDTETTGLDPATGHRIIEIGGVELSDRRLTGVTFHRYLNPEREIDEAASEVHGMTWKDLKDKPLFADIAEELFSFLEGAELVIHNAPFDVGFLNAEFHRLGRSADTIDTHCEVLDTLAFARSIHPGQRNSLDALCKRYHIDNSTRTLHGALLDAEILADVYLAMTGGQTSLMLDSLDSGSDDTAASGSNRDGVGQSALTVPMTRVKVSEQEMSDHEAWLDFIEESSGKPAIWRSRSGVA